METNKSFTSELLAIKNYLKKYIFLSRIYAKNKLLKPINCKQKNWPENIS